ncbi:MAG: mechanosensitive ion channel [Gammaproteobacteria bacterium]
MDWNLENYQQIINDYAIPWGINLVLAIIIFVVGKWLAKVVVKSVKQLMVKSSLDHVLVNFLGSLLKAALMVVVIVAALDQLGVDTKSVLAIFAAAGIAVGLALKDSLSNFAAGVMIVMFKPFKIGDFIDAAGINGVVEKTGIFNTIMRTGDNREINVPNSKIYGDVITNFSARNTRRIDMVIGIGYDDDIKVARDLLEKILGNESRVLEDPEPVIMVSELGASSVDLAVRPWVNSADYWNVRSDLLETIKTEFDANGISIPYPQTDVHLFKDAS